MRKTCLLGVVCACAFTLPVNAALVVVDADEYAIGTALNSAYQGVTLSAFGNYLVHGDIVATNNYTFPHNPPAGENIFGWLSTNGHWNRDFALNGGEFRADFDMATDFVSIDFVHGFINYQGMLRAYNINDNLLETFITPIIGSPPFYTASITRSTADISYIIASGYGGTNSGLDRLQFNAIPIPAAAWLFGSGLLGLVGMARKKA